MVIYCIKNDTIICMKTRIDKMGINGEGIAYDRKSVLFIEDALPGEMVEYQVISDSKAYKKAKCLKVYERSKDRKEPECPYYKRCGGCQIMYMNYSAQLDYKRDMVVEALNKYALIDESVVEDTLSNENVFGYRNSLKLPFMNHHGKLTTGLYEKDSNHIMNINKCLIHDKGLERVRKNIVNVLNKYGYAVYDYKNKKGIRSLFIRVIDNHYQACIVTGEDVLDSKCLDDLERIEGLESIYQSIHTTKSHEFFGKQMIHLRGKKSIGFTFNGLRINLSIRAFFQLNTRQSSRLYELVKKEVKDNQNVIFEAYSGIGIMSLMMKDKAKKIIGVESIADAVNNARKIAKDNGIDNVSFVCDDAPLSFTRYAKKEHIDTLIVDPPRTGLSDDMLEAIIRSRVDNMIYVSCNPSTLAKNLMVLKKYYNVLKVKPVDMFSNCASVESITVLKRKQVSR